MLVGKVNVCVAVDGHFDGVGERQGRILGSSLQEAVEGLFRENDLTGRKGC